MGGKFITPALRQAGWDEMLQIREEASLSTGDNTRRLLLEALLYEALAPGESVAPDPPEAVVAHG